jgi:hypothetical protein
MLDLYEVFKDAENTGQEFVVIYHGGSAPGTKRRIVIAQVDHTMAVIHEPPDRKPKSYFLNKSMSQSTQLSIED